MKKTVMPNHRNEIDELKSKVREMNDTLSFTKSKMGSLEQNMSTMVREVVNFCFDQRVE